VVARNTLVVAAVLVGLYVVYLLRKPITWVVIAAFIAIALSGPINALAPRIGRRGLAILVVYLALVLIPVGLGALIIPPLVTQAADLAENAPQYARDVTDFVERNQTLSKLEKDFDITGKLEEQAGQLPGRIGSAAGTLSSVGIGLVNSIFALVTILIMSVFLVGSGRRWVDYAIAMRPPRQAARLGRTSDRIARAIGAYVGGALAQALIAGVTTYIVLAILGVPFAAPLAVTVAVFDLIPLIGATIGAVIVGLVTVFTDFPTATIVWAIWAIIYQQVENTIIQPQIQKRAVAINPFVVIVSVLFGSTLFGVLGALLAVPLAASVQIIVREYFRLRRHGEPPPAAVRA
jgi:predicted PurR-regulated permease PerM